MLVTTCGLIFLMVQRSPSKSSVLLGIQLFPFAFWTIQQHYPLLNLPKPSYHKFDGGKIIADVMSAWEIDNVWTQDPYDAAWIRFYGPYQAHSSPRFGWDSQFNLWPKVLGEEGIFVQRTEEALPVTSDYRLYNQQPVSSFVPGYTAGSYTQTHSWRTLLFEKRD